MDECWEAATLQVAEKDYVGEELVDLLGKIQLSLTQEDSQLTHPQAGVLGHVYKVDTCEGDLPRQSGNEGSTEVLVEQI